MRKKDLLIEIGTEELPPRALKLLGESFANGVHEGLDSHSLVHGPVSWFATPRRLAVIVQKLIEGQKDQKVLKRGPSLTAAFDQDGSPTRAAEGFARSCNVNVKDLEKLETEKGSWLTYRVVESGKLTVDLLPDIIRNAMMKLPVPKRMRWGDTDFEFVRPVHWAVVLFGKDTINMELMGVQSDNKTYGHRFHYPKKITLASAKQYTARLKDRGYVVADFTERKKLVEDLVIDAATRCNGSAVIDPGLLDEVTSLVEWPVAVTGRFDEKFLILPREVLIATMQDHQKYFPVMDKSRQKLVNYFITISNIESSNPVAVSKGNERVILPRLSDAAFFWQRDCNHTLEAFYDGLGSVTYQKQLGSLADKTERVKKLSSIIATKLKLDPAPVMRAAHLAKCDLLSEMVGEFPELQGVMGRYYALHNGETDVIANAIDEQYMPRHAGAELPHSPTGQILAIADKIDTMVGIFGTGQIPTGDRDPFGLRRSAIGVLRICVDYRLPLDLKQVLEAAWNLYPAGTLQTQQGEDGNNASISLNIEMFILERAKYYLLDLGYTPAEVEAVLDLRPIPAEYIERLKAIRNFTGLPEAADLAEADKRIRNIISKSGARITHEPADAALMQEQQEKTLLDATRKLGSEVDNLIKAGNFSDALKLTAQLHGPVTEFFTHVMVNADDVAQKKNRFALLHEVANLTNRVANISRLAT